MTAINLRQLAVLSIRDPSQAARVLLSTPAPREAMWTALALVAVLNALLFSVSNLLVPGPTPLPVIFNTPIIYCFLVAGGLILTIYALFWVGRAMGGKGAVDDIMRTILWLQVLRIIVQTGALVLLMTLPSLSVVLVLGASLYGIFILLHFINQAHQLDSLVKSAGVLIAAMVVMVLGLSLFISLFGGAIIGSFTHV